MARNEQKYIQQAFETNYIAPIGQNIDLFEEKLASFIGQNKKVVALNSGTSAIHLALQLLNVQKDDVVICPSFTFVATANPILYSGAIPIFVDSENKTWNICPNLLVEAIESSQKKPKAIIVVHTYGMPAQMNEILEISNKYQIPIIEDSAEALGSFYNNKACGTFGDFGIFSFNGNKIITTSAGGALVCSNDEQKNKTLFLATQAKENTPFYEHLELGYNYRMSNVLAGIGCGQMEVLDDFIQKRQENFKVYKENFENLLIQFQDPNNTKIQSNYWLTSILFENEKIRAKVEQELFENNIECRRLWKPLHQQKLFSNNKSFTNGISEMLFHKGLSLPSGSNLSEDDQNRIIKIIQNTI